MTISLPVNKFDWDHNAVFAHDVLQEMRSLPMISDAAVVHGVRMRAGSYLSNGTATIEGHFPANDSEKSIYGIRIVSPGYFATLQIPNIAGRALGACDEERQRGAVRNILVSDSFAKRFWPRVSRSVESIESANLASSLLAVRGTAANGSFGLGRQNPRRPLTVCRG